MHLKASILALGMFGASASAAWGTSVALQPSKDNTLIQATNPAAQLSNGQGDIFVGRTNQDGQGVATISIRRGLVAFDVANNVPAGSTITGVTLTMRDVMGLNGNPTVQLHRTLQDWGEGNSFQNGGMGAAAQNNDATWLYTFYNSTTPLSSPTWSTPGGNYSSTISGSAVILAGPSGQVFTWSSTGNAQMIADVQSWLDNPGSNFGWTLTGDESQGQTAKRFNSGESVTSPNLPPVLTISYLVPEPSALALAGLGIITLSITGCARRRLARIG